MKTTLSIVGNVLLYVALVAFLVFGLPRALSAYLGTEYPMAAVTSGSMWPVLKTGDLVFIEGASHDTVQVGDIVVYRNETGGGFTIHRIVKMNDDTFITKGDANFSEDKPVPYDRLIGKTVMASWGPLRVPFLGSVTMVASDLRGTSVNNANPNSEP